MIELHGWITLRESYKVEDEDENLPQIISELEKYIEDINFESNTLKLVYHNGIPNITITLYCNRMGERVKEIFDLFKKVGEIAEGSYGLVYILDDEDNAGKNNEFQVYVLARGKLTLSKDIFLSPFIPVVEDSEK